MTSAMVLQCVVLLLIASSVILVFAAVLKNGEDIEELRKDYHDMAYKFAELDIKVDCLDEIIQVLEKRTGGD